LAAIFILGETAQALGIVNTMKTATRDWSQEELFILAFDHRGTFTSGLLGIKGCAATKEEKGAASVYKEMIYEGFKKAIQHGVPRANAGILVDEEFGSGVLRQAKKEGYTFAMPVEKSGQDEFDLEYSADFKKHIEDYDPTFVKVLVRYNPEGDKETNSRQLKRLKTLNDYLKSTNRPFLFELLVPATKTQLDALPDKKQYDTRVRPKLMVAAMAQIQDAGVDPTIWKLEGVDSPEDSSRLVAQARRGGRKASVVTLGRGESKEMVQKWVEVGAMTKGVSGFAVGRTIWWDPLNGLKAKKTNREQAIQSIAENYQGLVKVFNSKRKSR
jgi:5-dehydro-2-deoxygluconokinase